MAPTTGTDVAVLAVPVGLLALGVLVVHLTSEAVRLQQFPRQRRADGSTHREGAREGG